MSDFVSSPFIDLNLATRNFKSCFKPFYLLLGLGEQVQIFLSAASESHFSRVSEVGRRSASLKVILRMLNFETETIETDWPH